MKQAAFEERYAGEWDRFERWLDRHDRLRKPKSSADSSLPGHEVPAAYRRICQLLALSRERQYSPDLIDRLNRLALRGHHLLYGPMVLGLSIIYAGYRRVTAPSATAPGSSSVMTSVDRMSGSDAEVRPADGTIVPEAVGDQTDEEAEEQVGRAAWLSHPKS